ncbi:methyl-accepting chemotaxis protein [Pokkaliibacter sp. CJK22405]|uniref:methyl-accepting chemotaxis protein n=1 Tax=Pokkaliibacter sp. CJK22405 TaxID=3384615 RepID=UPI003984AE30
MGRVFQRLYKAVERRLFFTLTRKLLGNLGFIFLATTLPLWGIAWAMAEQGDRATEAWLMPWLWGIALSNLVICTGIGLYMRHLFLHPIRHMIDVLSAIKEKDGDISASLPTFTYDEISLMAERYNHFSGNLKEVIDKVRGRSVTLSLEATRVRKVVASSRDAMAQLEQASNVCYQESEKSTHTVQGIASHTSSIAAKNTATIEKVGQTAQELTHTSQQIEQAHVRISEFQQTVGELRENSDQIQRILAMVNDFSDQTNLLALNAAIEAARAGDHGRGFSVVADEVRQLSQKVGAATKEIHGYITHMSTLVDHTQSASEDIQSTIDKARTVVETTCRDFSSMQMGFRESNEEIAEISHSLAAVSTINEVLLRRVAEIQNLTEATFSAMDQARGFVRELTQTTEETQQYLSRYQIGRGSFEKVLNTARGFRDELQAALPDLAKGANLFDQHYQQVANTQPPKFLTSYTRQVEDALRQRYDAFLKAHPGLVYAILVDARGYAPAHHAHVSQPETGDPAVDNLKSRHHRLFDGSEEEKRRAANTQPFLLQTFIRDTGEVMFDLSLPLYIDGKHWGALIMGMKEDSLTGQPE